MATWDITKPAITTSLRNSNPQILDNWDALQDALSRDHVFPGVYGSTAGRHSKVTIVDASAPTAVADHTILYSTGGEVYAINTTNTTQITSSGNVNGAIPSGGIIIWTGTLAGVPSGYYLCDGSNSTPNLLEKMLRSVAAGVNPGGTGGSDTHDHGAVTGAGAPGAIQVVTDQSGANVDKSENHTHSIASDSSLPAYYSVAFIMKS